MKKRYIILTFLLFLFLSMNKVSAYSLCATSGTTTKSGNTITWSGFTLPYFQSNTASYVTAVGTADSVSCGTGHGSDGSSTDVYGKATGYVQLSSGVSVTNGTLKITATNFKKYLVIADGTDSTNNFVRAYIDISKYLDSTKPTISNCKVSNQTTTSYKVTCTVSDNIGVTKVQFPTWTNAGSSNGQDDLIWHQGTISGSQASATIYTSDHNNEAGKYTTHIYAYDAAGNYSTAGVTVNIDRTAPSCTNSGDSTTWTSSDRIIYYGCDDASGCNASYSGGSQVFSETTTTSQIPGYTIKDIYNNSATCPARTANVYVDKSAPEITNVSTSNKTTTKINLVVAASDEGSGIEKYEFKLDDGEWIDNGNSNVYTFENLKNKEYKIKVRVTDSVGLSTETEIEAKPLDLEAPKISAEPDTTDWVEQRVVTIEYPTGYGEEYSNEYSLDGITWKEYTEPLVFTEEGEVYARVVDSAGNTSVTSSYYVMNVGKIDSCPSNSTMHTINEQGNIQLEEEVLEISIKGQTMNGGFVCLSESKIVTKARLIRGDYILNYDGVKMSIEGE